MCNLRRRLHSSAERSQEATSGWFDFYLLVSKAFFVVIANVKSNIGCNNWEYINNANPNLETLVNFYNVNLPPRNINITNSILD